jgi:hypothetical protein
LDIGAAPIAQAQVSGNAGPGPPSSSVTPPARIEPSSVIEKPPGEPGNPHGKISGQISEERSGASGNAHGDEPAKNVGQTGGHFRGQIPVKASTDSELQGNAQQNAHGNAHEKNRGQIDPKSVAKPGNAHGFSPSRTEWFRYEMDFRDRKKGGYQVLIRRRLKWSETRYSPQLASYYCADLTEKMVKAIKDGKFTAPAIAALQRGGISDEIIKKLAERIGKGNGKRAAELTDHERSILARIESGLAAGGRRRNAPAAGTGRGLGLRNLNVPSASDGEFTEVPNVH